MTMGRESRSRSAWTGRGQRAGVCAGGRDGEGVAAGVPDDRQRAVRDDGMAEETTGRELRAIERPEGPVVEHLRNSGPVHHLKASQVRCEPSQAKDDRRDARWLAMVLELRRRCLVKAEPVVGEEPEDGAPEEAGAAVRPALPELLGLLGGQDERTADLVPGGDAEEGEEGVDHGRMWCVATVCGASTPRV